MRLGFVIFGAILMILAYLINDPSLTFLGFDVMWALILVGFLSFIYGVASKR